MLTDQGNDILRDIYSKFRDDWVEQFPGSNENDVERHFLYSIYQGLNDTHFVPSELEERIEKIR